MVDRIDGEANTDEEIEDEKNDISKAYDDLPEDRFLTPDEIDGEISLHLIDIPAELNGLMDEKEEDYGQMTLAELEDFVFSEKLNRLPDLLPNEILLNHVLSTFNNYSQRFSRILNEKRNIGCLSSTDVFELYIKTLRSFLAYSRKASKLIELEGDIEISDIRNDLYHFVMETDLIPIDELSNAIEESDFNPIRDKFLLKDGPEDLVYSYSVHGFLDDYEKGVDSSVLDSSLFAIFAKALEGFGEGDADREYRFLGGHGFCLFLTLVLEKFEYVAAFYDYRDEIELMSEFVDYLEEMHSYGEKLSRARLYLDVFEVGSYEFDIPSLDLHAADLEKEIERMRLALLNFPIKFGKYLCKIKKEL